MSGHACGLHAVALGNECDACGGPLDAPACPRCSDCCSEDRATPTPEAAAFEARLLAERWNEDHGPSCRCRTCNEDRR